MWSLVTRAARIKCLLSCFRLFALCATCKNYNGSNLQFYSCLRPYPMQLRQARNQWIELDRPVSKRKKRGKKKDSSYDEMIKMINKVIIQKKKDVTEEEEEASKKKKSK